ncbi:MAG: hypothetical protein IJR61_06550 [Clostridia bacterium]|nr:hypothetical protein [Clostridia bacterium]
MKRAMICVLGALFIFQSCGSKNYVLTEKNFFLVMTNAQYYPEQYLGKDMSFDCFTYRFTDVDGKEYTCGVRKCSSGYGCKCGKDTVIGFILEYAGDIPEPVRQSEDCNEKAWIHVTGRIKSAEKTTIKIYAYLGDEPDYSTVEEIAFLTFGVNALERIEDYSSLNYYVTK